METEEDETPHMIQNPHPEERDEQGTVPESGEEVTKTASDTDPLAIVDCRGASEKEDVKGDDAATEMDGAVTGEGLIGSAEGAGEIKVTEGYVGDEAVIKVGKNLEGPDLSGGREDECVGDVRGGKEVEDTAVDGKVEEAPGNMEVTGNMGDMAEDLGLEGLASTGGTEKLAVGDATENVAVAGVGGDREVKEASNNIVVTGNMEQTTEAMASVGKVDDFTVGDVVDKATAKDSAGDSRMPEAVGNVGFSNVMKDENEEVLEMVRDKEVAEHVEAGAVEDVEGKILANELDVTDKTDAMEDNAEVDKVRDEDEEAPHMEASKEVADSAEVDMVKDEDEQVSDVEGSKEIADSAEVDMVKDEDEQVPDVEAGKEIAADTTEADMVKDEDEQVPDMEASKEVADSAEVDMVKDQDEQVPDMEASKEVEDPAQTKIYDVLEHQTVENEVHADLVDAREDTEAGDTREDADVTNVPEDTAIPEAEKEMEVAEALENKDFADMTDDTDVADIDVTDAADDTEMGEEAETDVAEEGEKAVGGKRKRGKNVRLPLRTSRKKMEEDVCFICFDGGDLVLCDRRGCPKAYHPSCVNRDEAFFRSKGRWNCGWHLCSICEKKNAHYMCYTCTFSLCKGCIKDAVILCVRGNKGLCETCMKTVMLIENNDQQKTALAQVDFDDRNSWEYLFKDYWLDLKGKLSITSEELAHAKNPWKGTDTVVGRQQSPGELYDANNDGGSVSGYSPENVEVNTSKRKRAKKQKSGAVEEGSPSTVISVSSEKQSTDDSSEWASRELLEFVMHMRNGDKSVLSQFDVQALLLEYIKRNKLRDPRRKSQIVCDLRLQNLFGKPRVGHFEMLKLLESHFLVKEDSQVDDHQGSVVDTETSQWDGDGSSDALVKRSKDKKRKNRRKSDERETPRHLDDYAAIDMHNIKLVYLRRNLVEELLEDIESFNDKVVGSFVRIRIYGSNQKQDLYRLVQVVGTSKTAEPYKVGKKITDIVLEILNLDKTEVVSIDVISNQEFTEDECKRLRQSIKCGLINRLSVGDILEKATALQAVRVNDELQSEITRLCHLRDRASDMGRRKELRECVEKLQLLKTPEECQRRLEEVPEIHEDPKMDPSYESEEDEGETEDKRRESFMKPRSTGFSRRVGDPVSPRKGRPASIESWGENRNYSTMNPELTRNMSSKGFSSKGNDNNSGEIVDEYLRNQGRDREMQQALSGEKSKIFSASQIGARNVPREVPDSMSGAIPEVSPAPPSSGVAQSSVKINETEKIWHYQDPSGKTQGPFSIVQLRKWNNTGYFPADLRIWRTTEKQEDAILLTDALSGKFHKESLVIDKSLPKAELVQNLNLLPAYSGQPRGASLQQLKEGHERENWGPEFETGSSKRRAAPPVEIPKHSTTRWDSDYNRRNDSTNLPSPTPSDDRKVRADGSKWSANQPSVQQASSALGANSFQGGNVVLQHLTALCDVGQLAPASTSEPSSVRLGGGIDGSKVLSASPRPVSEKDLTLGSASSLQMHSQSVVSGDSHKAQTNSNLFPALTSGTTLNQGADMKVTGATFQNFVMPGSSNNSSVDSQAWGSFQSQKPESNNSVSVPALPSAPSPAQPPAYGHWSSAPSSVHNPTSSNPSGSFAMPGPSGVPPSESWGPAMSNNQANIQPPGPPALPSWGMGITDNSGAAPRQGPENQNTSWGPMAGNPNVGWGGPLPGVPNMNWGPPAQGHMPGPMNPAWATPTGPVGGVFPAWAPPAQGPPPVNTNPNWGPPAQGPQPVNGNPSWGPPAQGPVPGNTNPGWSAHTGNAGMWRPEPNNNGDGFANQRERGSHGGDSAYGGGKPWNRQSSFGSREPPLGVCRFHESGYCKKGASCNFVHR